MRGRVDWTDVARRIAGHGAFALQVVSDDGPGVAMIRAGGMKLYRSVPNTMSCGNFLHGQARLLLEDAHQGVGRSGSKLTAFGVPVLVKDGYDQQPPHTPRGTATRRCSARSLLDNCAFLPTLSDMTAHGRPAPAAYQHTTRVSRSCPAGAQPKAGPAAQSMPRP